ncbi:putative Adenylyltransferase and sulfurtransferase MOCS3-1 [Paratrimastix pyriformis]|uniref:Adenylyltransferase and sulfurtransferase MOCS3-1 n=1 Tax=Paratrimastix pyriformis TaxID=342808 RepID=A0ABQ8U341_9EUKA|nr:putative Adenylyltransferase and sulfurtransferase MOCS3-1 [Paratrimastix pyriformis]
MLSPTLQAALYFGTARVHFDQVPGHVYAHRPGCLQRNPDIEAAKATMFRLKPQGHLGQEYENIMVNWIPAADLTKKYPAEGSDEQKADIAKLPVPLQQPLLKVPSGPIEGIRSGGRSALLAVGGDFYRLKGCGNYVDAPGFRFPYPGFPLADEEVMSTHGEEMFQFAGKYIGQLLAADDLVGANRPVGVFQYDEDAVNVPSNPSTKWLPDGRPNPSCWSVGHLPRIPRLCPVFHTLGDRRLGTHLLAGLERLLSALVDSVDVECIRRAAAAANRLVDPSSPTLTLLHTGAIRPPAQRLINFESLLLADPEAVRWRAPQAGAPPVGLPEVMQAHWEAACPALQEWLGQGHRANLGSLISRLYWRLGREAGAFNRLLRRNGISWGYFIDHSEFEPHCNSHPNNFVVLPPALGERGHRRTQLLGPLDFDMAFCRNEFISKYSGTRDLELFDSWTASEVSEMQKALGGDTANTGLMGGEAHDGMSAETRALRCLLRDTIVLGHQAGVAEEPEIFADCPEAELATHALIQLGLMMTATESA